jgi:hypothetical protein
MALATGDRIAVIARILAKHENGEHYEGYESTHRELAARIADALPSSGDEWLEKAAKIADAIEVHEDNDHGAANTGGAARVAAAIRALKSTPPSSRKTTPTDGGEG